MPDNDWSPPTRRHLPIILIRGFGGLGVEDEKALAYQGFNDGSVYPQKRGENYIYEGLDPAPDEVRSWQLPRRDQRRAATSRAPLRLEQRSRRSWQSLDPGFFTGSKVVIDPGDGAPAGAFGRGSAAARFGCSATTTSTIARFPVYGEALVRLIDFIRALIARQDRAADAKVNIIAHSMGGLIVREAIQVDLSAPSGGAARPRPGDQQDRDARARRTRASAFRSSTTCAGCRSTRSEELEAFNEDKQTQASR